MENETIVPAAADTLPSIAIVGRPNVGKSSLFNAILKRRTAIVHFDSGVTRDRVTGTGVFYGRRFNLIDTGGLGVFPGEAKNAGIWDLAIERQVEAALDESAAVIFLTDVTAGLTPLDQEIARRLRATGRKIVLAVNKCDSPSDRNSADEFHALGFDKIFPVSSLHRRGIEDLMEEALSEYKVLNESDAAPKRFRIAVAGRPNAGKSSLVNRILGRDRVIVSDIAGTTRDSIDIDFTLRCGDEDVPATLVDTAGLRKRSKVDGAVERYSAMRAEDAINHADLVIFLTVAEKSGATAQDKSIAKLIKESGKACILAVNKWDLCQGEKKKEFQDEIRYTLPKMDYAPMVFISAKNGYNLKELFETVAEVRAQSSVRISTAMVNRVIGDAVAKVSPPVVGPKPFKCYYGSMVGNLPPTFRLFVNDPKALQENYQVYLEKYLRTAFGFTGLPIRLELKARPRRELVFVENAESRKRAGKNKGMVRKAAKTTVYIKPDSKLRGTLDPEKRKLKNAGKKRPGKGKKG